MMIHPNHRVSPSGRKLAEKRQFRGLDIHVENKVGSRREWSGGSTLMLHDYGYIPMTRAAGDFEHLDVYVGPHANADRVWVVRQLDTKTGGYDEDKCMLGFDSRDAAIQAFDAHRNDAPQSRGDVVEMGWGEFVAWCIDKGNWGRPVTPLEKALAIARIAEKSGQTLEAQRRSAAKYAANPKNKRKRLAKWRIQSAKRAGKIKQPSKCQRCGKVTHKLDLHHSEGYSSDKATRKGRWLCSQCHRNQPDSVASSKRGQRNRSD